MRLNRRSTSPWRPVLLIGALACSGATEPTEPGPDSPAPTGLVASTTWRSELYPADWTPEFTHNSGAFLHDFSWAGYRAGEAPPVYAGGGTDVSEHGADPTGAADSTAAIQAAIDASDGWVTIPAGTYRLDGIVTVAQSGVRLQGIGDPLLYTTRTEGMSGRAMIELRGTPSEGADLPLVADAAPRSHVVAVADGSDIAVGDTIHIGWTITDAFVADHGMTGLWVSFNGQWRPFFRRTVTAVDAGTITVDVPLRYAALTRDGASVRVVEGYIEEVGIADLRIATAVVPAEAYTTPRTHAILLAGVADGWVTGVRTAPSPLEEAEGAHLRSGGLLVVNSRRVSVLDSELALPQHHGDGGAGYLYEVSRSNEILVADCVAREGRHNFIQNWDFGTSGVVWLHTTSEGGRAVNGPFTVTGFSEFHHSLAMANLIDASITHDGWQSKNRHASSSGAGHAGTQNVFWNTTGSGELHSLQFEQGYVVGTGPELTVATDPARDLLGGGLDTEPEDWAEGIGEAATLDPPSLYLDQRARRR